MQIAVDPRFQIQYSLAVAMRLWLNVNRDKLPAGYENLNLEHTASEMAEAACNTLLGPPDDRSYTEEP